MKPSAMERLKRKLSFYGVFKCHFDLNKEKARRRKESVPYHTTFLFPRAKMEVMVRFGVRRKRQVFSANPPPSLSS